MTLGHLEAGVVGVRTKEGGVPGHVARWCVPLFGAGGTGIVPRKANIPLVGNRAILRILRIFKSNLPARVSA